MLQWLFAALHLLGLGVGLGSIWARARAFSGTLDTSGFRRLFYADGWWGASAVLWIGTGLVRVLAGLEKGTDYYLHNHVFWAKMALLLAILVLEISPMLALIRWRVQVGRGESPDTSRAGRFARVSYIQAFIVVLMVLAATAMARGMGVAPRG